MALSDTQKDQCCIAIDSLARSSRGSIFFKNVSNDIQANRIPDSTLREFFHEFFDAFVLAGKLSSFREKVSNILKDQKYHLLGPVTAQAFGDLSTTLPFESLCRYYIDERIVSVPPNLTDQEAFHFIGESNIPAVLDGAAKFRSGKAMVWLAPQTDVDKCSVSGLPTADRLRDYLGLSHFSEDEFLVSIRFSGITGISSLRRPTSFDAGANLVFRTDANIRKYGYTVDLGSYSPGSREVLSEPISASMTVSAAGLGEISSTPNVNWTEFDGHVAGSIEVVKAYVRRI